MRRFLAAIRFLTILPLPGTGGTAEADLAGSVPLFPVVGLLLGGVAAGLAWAVAPATPPLIAALLIVVTLMSFSGCLHLDGLSDTADGFLSSRTRERILEIMHDSHAGAMGLIAIVTVLLAKFAALASIRPGALWPAVLLMPLAGRCAMVLHIALLPYVRPGGLGAVFCRSRHWPAAVWAWLVLAAATWALYRLPGLVIWIVCLGGTLLLALYTYRKIGGATGDTFGAACELIETLPALTLAVWPLEVVR